MGNRYAVAMLSEWLRQALKTANIAQAELARRLTTELGRSIDRAAVNKMILGDRAISGDELLAIEKITGMEAPREIQVPLKGRVGAGAAVYAIDAGDDDKVAAPAEVRPGTVAVQVTGESMFPVFEDGTLLYYSRLLPPAEMINRRAVVQTGDGRIYVKIVRRGSTENTWTLQSINLNFPDMVDEVVEWAAPIDWTKPRDATMPSKRVQPKPQPPRVVSATRAGRNTSPPGPRTPAEILEEILRQRPDMQQVLDQELRRLADLAGTPVEPDMSDTPPER